MKNIFRQLGIMAGFFAVLYLFFLVLTYVFWPCVTVDNRNPTKSFFNFYDPVGNITTVALWGIKYPSPKRIFIVGGSNTGRTFPPSALQKMLPDFTVSSVVQGGSTIIEMRNIFDIIRMASAGSMKGTIFIVGLWYGEFSDDQDQNRVQWENKDLTHVEAEALRYGLYTVNNDELKPVLDAHSMRLTANLLRPILLWNIIFSDAKNSYDEFWRWEHSLNEKKFPPGVFNEEFKQTALNEWNGSMGSINIFMEPGGQTERFLELCKAIEQSGASLVLVDIPLPQWHRERSVYNQKYLLRKSFYLNQVLQLPRAQYLDLSTYLPDSDFYDSVHLTEQSGQVGSRAVSQFVRSRLNVLMP